MQILKNVVPSASKIAVTLMVVMLTALLLGYRYLTYVLSVKATGDELTVDILNRGMLFQESPPDIHNTKQKLHIFNSQDLVKSLEILLKQKSSGNASAAEFEFIEPDFHSKPEKKKGFISSIGALFFSDTSKNDVTKAPLVKNINQTVIKINSSEVVHFAFVGDSRIRQLFAMFLRAIPDYDRLASPSRVDVTAQVSIPTELITFSKLMGTIVSYSWCPLLRDNNGTDYVDSIKTWITSKHGLSKSVQGARNRTPLPDYLLIGSFVHHMLEENEYHEQVFFNELEELVPLFNEISKHCTIVWLNQYPTIEAFSASKAHPTDVHAQKILQYNLRVNNILRKSGVQIWNSASVLVEEYIRSCAMNRHHDSGPKRYFACGDYIHPGISALSDMTQILYNYWLPVLID